MYTPPPLLHLVLGGGEMSAELIELSNALVRATDRAAASVVAIHAEARGSSSGVIWRPGVIVTAEHALRRDEEIQITLPNGRIVPATLAGRDPSIDLAVLKCPDADSALPERGDAVDAHGTVVGIASPRFSRLGAVEIQSATVDRVAETLLQKGRIPRGYL